MPRFICILLLLSAARWCCAQEALVVVAASGVPRIDQTILQRVYTGRAQAIGDQTVTPVHLPAGNALRQQFLEQFLGQNEEQYTGYWLVRRYVGKGAPPREFPSVEEALRFIGSTPGALGYVPLSKVPPGANVIFRR
ncbi:MAG: hypothetical protein D3M94_20800 [Rhodocyclales bacterium GT-UBC]|nr:MAG: hypothetical protein D3M94_20800 [Rhodocyclales bacterium GT-UBC]